MKLYTNDLIEFLRGEHNEELTKTESLECYINMSEISLEQCQSIIKMLQEILKQMKLKSFKLAVISKTGESVDIE